MAVLREARPVVCVPPGPPPGPLPGPALVEWAAGQGVPPAPARGVLLPFTAPALTAMRVRAAGGGLEMILANPAGGRGFYIARWSALRAYAAPSLHDIMLAERLAGPVIGADTLSPASIRSAAIEIAAQAYAGRALAIAARAAQGAQSLGLRRLRAQLLLDIARRLDIPGSHSARNDPWSTDPQEHAGWLGQAPSLLVRHLPRVLPGEAWDAAALSEAVAAIARSAWPLGIGPRARRARLPRVLRLLAATDWSRRGIAGLEPVVSRRRGEAQAALEHARAALADPLALLADWRADPWRVTARLEQPDWLLDGWDRLCLLAAEGSPETGSLLQILLHAGESDRPLKPLEEEMAGGLDTMGAAASLDRLARNEAMRLREVQLHDPDRPHDGD